MITLAAYLSRGLSCNPVRNSSGVTASLRWFVRKSCFTIGCSPQYIAQPCNCFKPATKTDLCRHMQAIASCLHIWGSTNRLLFSPVKYRVNDKPFLRDDKTKGREAGKLVQTHMHTPSIDCFNACACALAQTHARTMAMRHHNSRQAVRKELTTEAGCCSHLVRRPGTYL